MSIAHRYKAGTHSLEENSQATSKPPVFKVWTGVPLCLGVTVFVQATGIPSQSCIKNIQGVSAV